MAEKTNEPPTLADSILALREQLETAAAREQAAETNAEQRLVPPLKVTEITLETEVVTNRDEKLGGKLNYWIATAEAGQKKQSGAKQKITIKMLPTELIDPNTGLPKSLTLGEKGKDVT